MYQKIDSSLKPTEREEKVSKFWNENDIFNETIKLREGCELLFGQMFVRSDGVGYGDLYII